MPITPKTMGYQSPANTSPVAYGGLGTPPGEAGVPGDEHEVEAAHQPRLPRASSQAAGSWAK